MSVSDSRTAPIQRFDMKVKDEAGKVRFIVDLIEDTDGKPARFVGAASKIDWHDARSKLQFDAVAKSRGIKILGSTSLVGTSFVAYLDEKEVEHLARDKQVAKLTEDAPIPVSALWNNTTDAGTSQLRSWGLHALGVSAGSLSAGGTVYVLDAGVEMHNDLTGLPNADRLTAYTTDANGQPINPSGCYAHATHVAGIVGAANNSYGVSGVVAGAPLVSMGLGHQNVGGCSQGFLGPDGQLAGYLTSAYTIGLDKIYTRVLQSNSVGIVNISSNGGGGVFGDNGTIGVKMSFIATPSPLDGYKGALVVQSAGNQGGNACASAYNANQPYDGILVVGGIDENGQPVRALNNIPAYSGNDAASNTGSCVEVWAPSQRVTSTWSGNGYATLGGTSMAAPHVAGLASAVLASNGSIQTSLDLESAVRNLLVNITGANLPMTRWNAGSPVAKPTIEIAIGYFSPIASLNTADRLSVTQNNFNMFSNEFDARNLRFESVGASSCYLDVYRSGYFQGRFYFATSGSIGGYGDTGQGGQFVWVVTCTSAQGQQTSVSATGYIRRNITLDWSAATTSTGGVWQTILHGGTVSWSASANAPFDQAYSSYNADYCWVLTYGFTGNQAGDPSNPNYNAFAQYQETLLWDSGLYFPTSYIFATFNFGDPLYSPYGIAPYNGYKWLLQCRNSDGDVQTKVMYGVAQS